MTSAELLRHSFFYPPVYIILENRECDYSLSSATFSTISFTKSSASPASTIQADAVPTLNPAAPPTFSLVGKYA